MVVVQTTDCCPIIKAFLSRKDNGWFLQNAGTNIANRLWVPETFGDTLILQALYQSQETAVVISDEAMLVGIVEETRLEGILLAPEGAATWVACQQQRRENV